MPCLWKCEAHKECTEATFGEMQGTLFQNMCLLQLPIIYAIIILLKLKVPVKTGVMGKSPVFCPFFVVVIFLFFCYLVNSLGGGRRLISSSNDLH